MDTVRTPPVNMSTAAASARAFPLGTSDKHPITIAILAMGGQGGGVLVDWIVDLAEHNDYVAQATSVAGVAQRTGATIYYIELFAQRHVLAHGGAPVLALMPVPGEVDIVLASELMEAGRAMQRGLVTQERTTLITSSHRDYATLEKVVPGNGIADTAAVLQSGHQHALRFLHDDMQTLAKQNGSVLSASLFGALAGSRELPFDDAAFEATIRRGGVGVEASLRACRAGMEAVRKPVRLDALADPMATAPRPLPARAASADVEPLRARIEREFPVQSHAMLGAGLQRVMEYQDIAYGTEYLDRMAALHGHALTCGGADQGHAATVEAARWIAVAMAYDDVIRVADLKTRAERSRRVREEVGAGVDEVVGTVEFFHPRLEEIYAMLPAGLVRWIESVPMVRSFVANRVGKGQRLRPHTLRGQLMLQGLSSMRRWRRRSQRHATETAHIEHWLDEVKALMKSDYPLALELISCRRLVKGYSDTHARGSSKFDRLLHAAGLLKGRPDAASDLAALRVAAQADPQGPPLKRRWALLGLPAEVAITLPRPILPVTQVTPV
jgi:indolepyruvate ferredoxin oxidoreductase beta subunit